MDGVNPSRFPIHVCFMIHGNLCFVFGGQSTKELLNRRDSIFTTKASQHVGRKWSQTPKDNGLFNNPSIQWKLFKTYLWSWCNCCIHDKFLAKSQAPHLPSGVETLIPLAAAAPEWRQSLWPLRRPPVSMSSQVEPRPGHKKLWRMHLSKNCVSTFSLLKTISQLRLETFSKIAESCCAREIYFYKEVEPFIWKTFCWSPRWNTTLGQGLFNRGYIWYLRCPVLVMVKYHD